jgi:hypothetical protein
MQKKKKTGDVITLDQHIVAIQLDQLYKTQGLLGAIHGIYQWQCLS